MVYPVKGFYLQIHDQEQILVQAVAVVVPAGSSGRARTRRLAILSMVRMNESNFGMMMTCWKRMWFKKRKRVLALKKCLVVQICRRLHCTRTHAHRRENILMRTPLLCATTDETLPPSHRDVLLKKIKNLFKRIKPWSRIGNNSVGRQLKRAW